MPQDVIGRGDVEEELGQAEGEQQRPPGEFSLRAVLEGEHDFLVPGGVDRFARQALDEIDRGRDPQFQFGNIGIDVARGERRMSGQQRAGDDRMAIGLADLLPQAVHVGMEPHVGEYRGLDVSRPHVGRGMVEQRGQIAEIRHEHADRCFVD